VKKTGDQVVVVLSQYSSGGTELNHGKPRFSIRVTAGYKSEILALEPTCSVDGTDKGLGRSRCSIRLEGLGKIMRLLSYDNRIRQRFKPDTS
jgi:hypothetical protein